MFNVPSIGRSVGNRKDLPESHWVRYKCFNMEGNVEKYVPPALRTAVPGKVPSHTQRELQ